jgi:lipid II:glycine glycyltransferase (peptidoglycan interpeptide bridge formation enzyme)
MFSLDLNNKTEEEILKNMKQNTRNIIKKTLKTGITIKELSFNELNKFHNILKETGARKNFKIRDINYYQDMYKLFSPKNEVKYLIAELNLNNYVENLEKEKQDKITKLSSNLKQTKKQELEKEIKNIDNKIKEAKKIKEKANNDIIVLSGSMFILTKPEIIYLSSGNYKEYLNFNSQYLLQWELIKYGLKNGYKKHNFYGIPENINEHPDNYGIYEFKKGFNGYVEELIGEYEIPIKKTYYLFDFIHKLKEVKYALHL